MHSLLRSAFEQWGINIGGAVQTSTLPITFTNVFLAVASTSTEWCCPGCSATNTTVTTRAYQSNRPDVAQPNDVNWIVIGCQPQWGFTLFEPATYKNVNFTLPLAVNGTFCAFSTGYDVKGSTFLWHSMSHFNNINVGVTGFVFDSRYTFTGLGYLAICWQKQWGYSTSTGEYVTHTFPIKFTVIPIVVAGALTSNTSGNTGSQSNPCYRSITVSNFVFCMYDNARGYAGSTYIAIGYQLQWGIISNNKAIFPLVFNLFVSSALLLNRGPGTGTWYGDSSNTTLTGISCVTPDYVLNGTYIAIGA